MSTTGSQPRAADLAGSLDWAATALGPRESWPAGMAGVMHTVLTAALPMALALGPDKVLVYNDAYAAMIGGKHPDAFGRPAPEVFKENWAQDGHGNVVDQVAATGEPFLEHETRLPVRGLGRGAEIEYVLFSRAYTAVRGDDGTILGVLTVISETTAMAKALSALAQLGGRLATALTVDDVTREALRHAVDVVGADHVRVTLAEGASLRMARRASADPYDESVERLPPLWSRVSASTLLPSVEVTRTGAPLWLDEGGLRRYTGLAEEPTGSRPLRAVAAVPLHAGTVRGTLVLGWECRREFSASDRAALSTVGRLLGQAMARAARFDEQRGNAEVLQRNMLPADLPQVPGISIAARYEPSAPFTSAGGDFYDAFPVAGDRTVIAIGDVVGHGVLAAAVMGQVRAALRVLALQDPDPVTVLGGLDSFVDSLGPEVFVTALVAVLDNSSGTLRLATAGHLPPLIRRGGAGSEDTTATCVDVVPAPPLGLSAPRESTTVSLFPGDLLLLFTDGLVEVAGEDIGVGLERLRDVLRQTSETNDVRRICSLVLDRFGTGSDDIAVVALTLDQGDRRTATLALGAESTAPGAARSWAAATLAAWGLPADAIEVALLATNELVTNALLHARTGSRVELDLDEQRLLVLVSDTGMASEVQVQGHNPTAVRGRGLVLVEALTDAWGSEISSRGTTVWFEIARR
ncbi:MAG: SpoIIE family protein phosphatase [Actinomycetes bacterium]